MSKSKSGVTISPLVIIVGIIAISLILSGISLVNRYRETQSVSAVIAQSSCDRSFFSIQSAPGYTFNSGCISNSSQMYSTDSRYSFFQPSSTFANQAYIQTPNLEIKDSTVLSWSLTLSRPATVYLLTRHIPGLTQAPSWITSSYTRQTSDDLSNINQYSLRKNDQGLIGLYDVYSKSFPSGIVNLSAASQTQGSAYSMYIVVIVPTGSATQPPATQPPSSIPPGTIGKLKTVFFIPLEDASWSEVKGNSSAPYINGTLLPNFSHAENDTGGFHPSLDNYFMMEGGDSFKVRSTQTPASYRLSDGNHLTNAMKAKGITWKSYQEGIPAGQCYTGNSSSYAVDHNPFVFYNDITGNPPSPTTPYCVEHIRPYDEFIADLRNNRLPQYNFIVPSPCNQGETGCPGDRIAATDRWLQSEIPKITSSDAYRNGGVIFITWMEASSTGNTVPVGLIVVSPNAKKGYSNSIAYRHYSVLHSIQDIFGITPLIRHAGTDASLSDLFTSYP